MGTVQQFFHDNQFVVGALTGSLAAYLLGLIVSYLRREKKWLGYISLNRNIISASDSDISIEFRGQKIARLDSHSVILKNIGNRPISSIPLSIAAAENAKIIEKNTRTPDGLRVQITETSPRIVEFLIDFLNPKEEIEITLTVSDSITGTINASCRIEGVSFIEMNDTETAIEKFLETVSKSGTQGAVIASVIRVGQASLKLISAR